MGNKANSRRKKWQDYSGNEAYKVEKEFFQIFQKFLKGTDYEIRKKPKEFSRIYTDIELSKQEISEIYNPIDKITKHGFFPDYAIDNKKVKKTIYVEVKRQDGWVEGKSRSSGRGNAHERSCKFFTPGLLKILREKGNQPNNVIPFWVIFQGDISRDPCRVREITCWYDNNVANYFFWRDLECSKKLIQHFEQYIKPLLC